MLQWIGSVLIMCASTLIGFYYAKKLSDRTDQLRELQMNLQMLETEIYYGSTPLEIACDKISQQNTRGISLLFGRFSYYLQHLDGATTEECWQRSIDDAFGSLALKKTEVEWLVHFGSVIGASDREDQQKHIRLLLSHFHKSEKEAHEEQHKYAKMYKTLGILGGMLIVILML